MNFIRNTKKCLKEAFYTTIVCTASAGTYLVAPLAAAGCLVQGMDYYPIICVWSALIDMSYFFDATAAQMEITLHE